MQQKKAPTTQKARGGESDEVSTNYTAPKLSPKKNLNFKIVSQF